MAAEITGRGHNPASHPQKGERRAAKANPKGERLAFRVTPTEKESMEDAAIAEGLKLSAWIRKRCGL